LSAVFAIIPAIFNSYIKKDMETPFIPFLALGFFSVLIFEELILEVLRNLGL
jgi:leader peptidase (prepilin peptidase)/N-methyltransferase